jgi:poly(A) polymerase
MDELEVRIAALAAQEELAAIRPELDGEQVMQQLGIAPGPLVGQALAYLLDVRLDEGLIGEAAIRDRLQAWYEAEHRQPAADKRRSRDRPSGDQ